MMRGEVYIAKHHFHPLVMLQYAQQEGKTKFPTYVSKALGTEMKLTEHDRHCGPRAAEATYYFNVPNQTNKNAFVTLSILLTERLSASTNAEELADSLSESAGTNYVVKRRLSDVKALDEAQAEVAEKERAIVDKHANMMASLTPEQYEYFQNLINNQKRKLRELTTEVVAKNLRGDAVEVLQQQLAYTQSGVHFLEILQEYGGVCRANITSAAWHLKNPTACHELFGFPTFKVLHVHLRCRFFEDFYPLDDAGVRYELFECHPLHENRFTTPITEYEKCLIARMRMWRRITLKQLGLIWGRDFSRISVCVKDWAHKWGQAGLNLSILPILPEFYEYSLPEQHKKFGMEKLAALVDGKCFMTEVNRSSSVLKRANWSDKVAHDAALSHAWMLACGLNVEHTPLFLGRLTEGALVKLWGSLNKTV